MLTPPGTGSRSQGKRLARSAQNQNLTYWAAMRRRDVTQLPANSSKYAVLNWMKKSPQNAPSTTQLA